jgi:hypothetical protein
MNNTLPHDGWMIGDEARVPAGTGRIERFEDHGPVIGVLVWVTLPAPLGHAIASLASLRAPNVWNGTRYVPVDPREVRAEIMRRALVGEPQAFRRVITVR